jgi:WG containing repeat
MRIPSYKFWPGLLPLMVCLSIITPAAGQSPEDFFRPKAPLIVDTIYYPFYQGVQMIEVDNIGYWDRHIYYLEQSRPRAIPYSALEPPPSPNVYLFRNSAGSIIKAFNTTTSLAELTAYFSTIPVTRQSNHLMHRLMPFHKSKAAFSKGSWVYSPNPMFFFNGFYKVYEMKQLNTGIGRRGGLDLTNRSGNLVGLIDSLGNLRLELHYQQIYPAGNDLLVMKNDKWGAMDKNGKVILPLQYDAFKYESENLVVFRKQGKIKTFYFPDTKKVIPIDDYDDIPNLGYVKENKCTFILKDGKLGLMDARYRIVAPPIYDVCEYHHYPGKNPVRVSTNKKWGFMDPVTGKMVIPCQYEHAEPFTEKGIALVQEQGKWQCIDTKGNTLPSCKITPDWKKVMPIGKNGAWMVEQGRYYGAINKAGKIIIPLIYTALSVSTIEDFLRVSLNSKHQGLLSVEGKELLPCVYDEIKYFDNHKVAIVVKDKLEGLIDKEYKLIAPCVYENLLYTNHALLVFSKNGRFGVLNSKGKIIIPAVYDHLSGFNEAGYAQAMKDSLYGIIDMQQRVVVPLRFKKLGTEFSHNRVWFMENEKFGFAGTGGTVIVPAQYDWVYGFEQKITGVQKGKKWAFIDTTGRQVTEFMYDHIDNSWMGFRYCRVQRDGKWGILDINAAEIIPCIYDRINGYSDTFGFPVQKGDESFYINAAGERIGK